MSDQEQVRERQVELLHAARMQELLRQHERELADTALRAQVRACVRVYALHRWCVHEVVCA